MRLSFGACSALADLKGCHPAYGMQNRAIFVHGFAKNEKDNIGKDELAS